MIFNNNGGKTDYYQLKNAPFLIKDFDDFAERIKWNQFNMGKVCGLLIQEGIVVQIMKEI